MNFAIYDAIHTLLLLLLILYISIHSRITKEVKLRIPFWTLIILMTGTTVWMKWEYPIFRFSILTVLTCGIIIIYYLSFRKRVKTRLDYLKLAWIILFFIDTLIINLMRSLLLKGVNNAFVNGKLVMRLDRSFDIIMLIYTLVIVRIIYTNEKKHQQTIENR